MDTKEFTNEDPNVTLTIRLIMQGKEVGSIIGKKGEIVAKFREESGANINISNGSCPERIVTVTGPTQAIYKAFALISKKFEDFVHQFRDGQNGGGSRSPITLRLIVPASQCGSLIGKGGSKIKEIREVTGANIQVASDMLPNSTERTVTITGSSDSITQCIYNICQVMLESPPKGATIPYRPKPQLGAPVLLGGAQPFAIQGNYAVPGQNDAGKLGLSPLASLAALGLGSLGSGNTGGLNAAALAALAGSQLRNNTPNNRAQPSGDQQTHEMAIPNDLIGCVIGKGGTKIAEIRQISGARIRISNGEEQEGGSTDRKITIRGSAEAVQLAQYLINMSVDLQKANLEGSNGNASSGNGGNNTGGVGSNSGPPPMAGALPLAQLLSKPGALNALTSLTALSGLTDLLGGLTATATSNAPVQTTGAHRNKPFSRMREGNSNQSEMKKHERNKFAPY